MLQGAPEEKGGLGVSALFFGHPLLDLLTSTSAELLEAYGLREGDVALVEERQMPIFTKLLEAKNTVYHAGGAAMNTARAMKWICPGMNACFVGAIGCDHFGEMLTETLDAAGVEHLFEYHENCPTGTCASLVFQKERSMLTNLGAATLVSLEHMKSLDVVEAIKKADVFYTEGFFLNTVSSPDNIMMVAEHAHREGKLFCFNLSAPYVSATFGDKLKLILPYVDILFGCREDFIALIDLMWSGAIEVSCFKNLLVRVAQLPRRKGSRPRLVISTCGSDETAVASENDVSVYPVPILDNMSIVDMTGAGDAFAAGFLAQYLCNPNIDRCVEAGHASASLVIQHWGAKFKGDPPQLSESN